MSSCHTPQRHLKQFTEISMAASDPERLVTDDNFPPGTVRLLSGPSTLILVPEPTTDPNDPLVCPKSS
ncbi:hypothetical protein CH063_08399 [Colletotrichum higginsianum]|uniref:Major facilitator superfamily transporter n=1 Tax=Colletotrichum higginsianum (strain IMI 349063) TaxID=759273 RepID=H1V9P4_COLHI|nr:Major facilitator superfamily transporter [Colletotrichum higginsianum IMI 349063]OBR03343.1 Major facilitator superfamily transporter [Colletotrichum higginsianum IMI 349063]CCF36947.1 hypothetical protein CH063_08399 [Colletotrichum higginsianum]